MSALDLLLLVVLHGAVLAGLLAVVLGLSGNFILLGLALAVAWTGGFAHLSLLTWFLLLGGALLAEGVEALLGIAVARRFGATRWGMIGTFAGGILGAVAGTAMLPVVGSLLGALLGSFAGAFLGEFLRGQGSAGSLRAGAGAFLGRAFAGALKLALGIFIAIWTLRAAYPLVGG